jgi:hypothetical protein
MLASARPASEESPTARAWTTKVFSWVELSEADAAVAVGGAGVVEAAVVVVKVVVFVEEVAFPVETKRRSKRRSPAPSVVGSRVQTTSAGAPAAVGVCTKRVKAWAPKKKEKKKREKRGNLMVVASIVRSQLVGYP